MKGAIPILVIVIVFIAFALIGYQVAIQQNGSLSQGSLAISDLTNGINKGEQTNFVIVHVERIKSQQPRLISVWYLSLYSMNNVSPTLSLVLMYPDLRNSAKAKTLGRSFSFTPQGEPSKDFVKAINAFNFDWEGYLMIDNEMVQNVMEWADGPGDYLNVMENVLDDPNLTQKTVQTTCEAIVRRGKAESKSFDWQSLLINHFQSSLHLEVALNYWQRVTQSEQPVNCFVVVIPEQSR